MRRFFKTPDGKLLEVESQLNLTKTNMEEYVAKTSNDASQAYMPLINKIDRGYMVKVNVPEDNCSEDKHNEQCDACCGEQCEDCKNNQHCEECEDCGDDACCDKVVFIELDVDGILRIKRYIAENEKPEINFYIPHGKSVTAYAYSHKGGLWMSTLKEDETK